MGMGWEEVHYTGVTPWITAPCDTSRSDAAGENKKLLIESQTKF